MTEAGQMAAAQLVAERRASLERLCEGWSPDQHEGLAKLLTRLAAELGAAPSEEPIHR